MRVLQAKLQASGWKGACHSFRHWTLAPSHCHNHPVLKQTYVLKLSRSGGEGDKVFLLLESGSRFHTTELIRDKADVPSNFTLKLRKHLRTRRLEDVRQLGVDRIVDFVFGSGEATMHLILEMYSQGNIVLTNAHYEVLTLLRSHRDDDKGFAVMARHLYPMQHVRLHQAVTLPELTAALQSPGPEPGTNLKAALAGSVLPYGPTIAEHVILDAGLDPGMKLKPTQPQTETDAAAEDGRGPEDEGVRDEEGEEEESGTGLPTEGAAWEQNGKSGEVAAVEEGAAGVAGGGEKGGKKGK
ncbi:fibronectin-binding protein A N-terminus-domain-containing protein, partial [Dunaliella salina]